MSSMPIIDVILHYQRSIEKSTTDETRLLHCLQKLCKLPVTVEHLQETGVGKTVNGLRKYEGNVGIASKALVGKWKDMVAAEEEEVTKNEVYEQPTHNEYRTDYKDSNNYSEVSNITLNGNSENVKSYKRKAIEQEDHNNSSRKKEKYDKIDKQTNENNYKDDSRPKQDSLHDQYDKKVNTYDEKVDEPSSHNKINGQSEDETDTTLISGFEMQEFNAYAEDEDEDEDKLVIDVCKEKEYSDKKKPKSNSDNRSSKDRHHKSKSDYRNNDSKDHRKDEKKRDKSSKSSDKDHKKHSKDKHYDDKNEKKDNYKKEKTERSEKGDRNEKSDRSEKSDRNEKSDRSEKSEKHSSKDQKSKEDNESNHKSKSKQKDKREKEHSRKNKREKQEFEDNIDESSPKKSKIAKSLDEGIDCSMGKSFEEALGMIMTPPSSKVTTKTKSPKMNGHSSKSSNSTGNGNNSDNKSNSSCSGKSSSSLSFAVPSVPTKSKTPPLLDSSVKLEPLDPSIVLALPTISPHYKPMPLNPIVMECLYSSNKPPRRQMTDEEALASGISSKTIRTKVYSGARTGALLQVPTLFDLCIRVLQKNIDALEYTGGVPFEVLKPVIERATPKQLLTFEDYNPYLMEDSDVLWQHHVGRHYRTKKRLENESWREMFLRCKAEQEERLSILAENIKQSQKHTQLPVRKTQLAYVDVAVKPPRNIQRKQEQFGTKSKVVATPASRVAALSNVSTNMAKVGDSRLKIAPGTRDTAQATTSNARPRKAPLMQKSLQLMKGRFKR